jgi:hypothetical protein
MSQTSTIQSLSCGCDERDAFGVCQVDGLARGASDNHAYPGMSDTKDMGLKRGKIWSGNKRGRFNTIVGKTSPMSSDSGRKKVGTGANIPGLRGRQTALWVPFTPFILCGAIAK